MKRYTIGNGEMPKWVADRIIPYMQMDGSTGYKFQGKQLATSLNVGDTLIMDNKGRITWERKGKPLECKRVFGTDRKIRCIDRKQAHGKKAVAGYSDKHNGFDARRKG